MFASKSRSKLFVFVSVLALVALACGTSSGGSGDVDLEATAAALEATAAAISSQPTQPPAPQNPPTQAPLPSGPTESTEPSGEEEFDWNSLQSGDVIYATDFDGNGEEWEDGWIWFTIPDEKTDFYAGVQNGFMVVELDDLYTTVYLVPDFIYAPRGIDVYVEASFDNVGTTRNNNLSIGCRGSADGWYEYSVTSSGLWYFYKYTPSDGFQVLNNGGIAGFEKETYHEVGLTCIGDTMTLYADGNQLTNGVIRDTSFREGQVFMAVYADNLPGVAVEMDYFYVAVP